MYVLDFFLYVFLYSKLKPNYLSRYAMNYKNRE